MRVENSLKNMYIGILSQIIITLLGFISRKVFLDNLGVTYLGINGFLTNIISLLGLIEAGIGTSIVYNLYKPIAYDDKPKIIALIQLYKRAYMIIASVVFVLSMMLYPFLTDIMNNSQGISSTSIIYLLFVAKNAIAYLYAHKWCLINADQKNYILAKNNLIFNIINMIIKIVILIITKNYIFYLIMEVIILIIQNIYNGRIVDKMYPYIKTKEKYSIDPDIRLNINKNVRALFLHNVGSYCIFGTDNLLISKFINLNTVGLYSSYTMIIGQLSSIVGTIMGSVGNSVGNLLATENNEKSYDIFNIMYLVNFWIYSIGVIFLYNLLEPFINWWLGEGYLLDSFTFIIILVNFYLTGMRSSISTFKNKAGIFIEDKYVPLLESAINLIVSIVLVNYMGLVGIFIGTTISTLSIVFWNVPRLVYKNVFNRSVWIYFIKYLYFIAIGLLVGYITTMSCNMITLKLEFISLVIKGVICILIPFVSYSIVFYKTKEFRYIVNILKPIIMKVKSKVVTSL